MEEIKTPEEMRNPNVPEMTPEQLAEVMEQMAKVSPLALTMRDALKGDEPRPNIAHNVYLVSIGAIQFFAVGTTKKQTMGKVYKFVKEYIPESALATAMVAIRRVNISYQDYVNQKLGYRPVVGMMEITWR